ncbi:heme ABC transporter ATP-binding protein [Tateyamaria sp. SN6-1]|uniref:heme ABC transporter ATP-binding protein n=1 Tax=Tateyamaria sp. SN6-1 TaxID=3092148 RepID=UPI0039F468D1
MITATGITARYGRKTVLSQLDFSARPGQVTAIVGPNGSGKSTLLKAITGELPITGDVQVEGFDIRATPAWQLAGVRAVLPQSTPMAFPFQALEVVQLGLSHGVSSDPTLPRRALARVGLSGYETRFCQELSGGEQQRVQLARVLCQVWEPVVYSSPRWLMLDEPVSSLDIGHQLQVMQIARDYADAGGGVIAVMHDLNLTIMFADTVVLMNAGAILADGKPDEVLTEIALSQVYNCSLRTSRIQPNGGWFIFPQQADLKR